MLSQDKFHKLCKYSLRLEKSFISGDVNNYTKYCSHLKHHIGGSNTKLDEMFDNLIKIIKEKQTDESGNIVSYDTLQNNVQKLTKEVQRYEEDNSLLNNKFEKLRIENEQLQNKVMELEKNKETNENRIGELEIQNNRIMEENNELNKKIQKYEAIIGTVNLKLNVINGTDNLNINDEKYEEELKTVLEQFENKLKSTRDTYIANDLIIAKNKEQIDNLTIENQNLVKKIEELEQANLEKDHAIVEKDKMLLEKNQEFEQFKLDNRKAIEQVIEDTISADIVEFKNKLAEILGTIYGQPLAQAIISGAKLGESQPEITLSEEEKIANETKLAEQVVKTPREQLLETEFEIYSAKKGTNDKKQLSDILKVNTQGKDKMNKLGKFKLDINELLNAATLDNLIETKTDIQNLINTVSGKEDGKLRISNSGKLQFGGDF